MRRDGGLLLLLLLLLMLLLWDNTPWFVVRMWVQLCGDIINLIDICSFVVVFVVVGGGCGCACGL